MDTISLSCLKATEIPERLEQHTHSPRPSCKLLELFRFFSKLGHSNLFSCLTQDISLNDINRKIHRLPIHNTCCNFIHFQARLPLNYTATISDDKTTWKGVAYIPLDYFPPHVDRFNAFAMHGPANYSELVDGVPQGRQFEQLYQSSYPKRNL